MDRYEALMWLCLISVSINLLLVFLLWSRPVVIEKEDEEDITPDYGHDPADGAWF